jgi:hypothetical protein
MAKVAGQAPVKKASKATPAPIKPVKLALTKSALVNLIAEENEIPRKTAAGVYATLENLFSWFGPSAWCRRVRAARSSEGQSTQGSSAQSRHPRPQSRDRQMVEAAAKPASVRVKIRALSKLKTAATP